MLAIIFYLHLWEEGKEVYWVKARVGKVPDVLVSEIIGGIRVLFCRHDDSAFLVDAGVLFKQDVYESMDSRTMLRSHLFT